MGGRAITVLAIVLLLGGAVAVVLAGFGFADGARSHHFALFGGGLPTMTVAVVILWVKRFKG